MVKNNHVLLRKHNVLLSGHYVWLTRNDDWLLQSSVMSYMEDVVLNECVVWLTYNCVHLILCYIVLKSNYVYDIDGLLTLNGFRLIQECLLLYEMKLSAICNFRFEIRVFRMNIMLF